MTFTPVDSTDTCNTWRSRVSGYTGGNSLRERSAPHMFAAHATQHVCSVTFRTFRTKSKQKSKNKNAKIAKMKCCVPGCDLKNAKSTFGIPDEVKEPFSRKIWIQALNLNGVKLTTYSRVCSHHFEPSDISPSNRLKRGTNPTRNLPVGYSLLFNSLFF